MFDLAVGIWKQFFATDRTIRLSSGNINFSGQYIGSLTTVAHSFFGMLVLQWHFIFK